MERIAFFTLNLRKGGAERVVTNLCNELAGKCYVTLILIDNDITYEVDRRVKIVKLSPIGDVKSGLLKFLLIPYYSYFLRVFLRRERISTLYSYLLRPNIISILCKLGVGKTKVIISERSNPIDQYATNSISNQVNRFLIKMLYGRADVITVNSFGSSIALKKYYKIKNQIEVIHNPISPRFYSSTSAPLNMERFSFISVGRLDEGKNHMLLIRAVKGLRDRGISGFIVNIVGNGPLLQDLSDYIDTHNLNSYIYLLGHRSDVADLFKEANCSVFVSKREGFPNVLLESIASRCVVITTDCPFGPREILTGENLLPDPNISSFEKFDFGLLVPVDNTLLLIDAMEYVMKNYKSFNWDNHSAFIEKYSLHHIANKILSLQ